MMVIGIVSAVGQGVLTGVTTRRWGEIPVIRGALLCTGLGFLLMLAASEPVTVLLTVGFFVLSNAMIGPSVASLISKQSPDSQGMAMGLNNAFMSLGRIVGPIWAGIALDFNLALPYLTGSMVMFAGFALSVLKLRPPRAHPAEVATSAPKPLAD
jgi:DHA1 family multidrug resistance protein-like MFS transporter